MKNHVSSLELSTFLKSGKLEVNGRIRVYTKGMVGNINVSQETALTVAALPKALREKLSNVVQEIEDYFNGVEEVAGGEVTMKPKKPGRKNPPHVEERVVREIPEDEFDPIVLTESDYLD